MSGIYSTGEYLENNPGWHVGDSAWKAGQILKMIETHDLQPRTICEVGCGAGEILSQLHARFPDLLFHGYEVSPQAYALCLPREREGLQFTHGDLLETREKFDLLLCIDVFEHVPNYLSFLKQLRKHAGMFIFHIPLDLSVLSLLRPSRLEQVRYGVGHLHLFTRESALAVLRDTGYKVVDSFLTAGSMELQKNRLSFRTQLANLPRRILGTFSPRLAARLLGGYSLMALAGK